VTGTVSLPVPVTPEGRAGLAALLGDPARALIALDFDGTLAPIVPTRPRPGRIRVRVPATAPGGGRGRHAGGDHRPPGRVRGGPGRVRGGPGPRPCWATTALERWSGGTLSSPPSDAGVEAARAELPGLLARAGRAGRDADRGQGPRGRGAYPADG